jgi:hypothetical protein
MRILIWNIQNLTLTRVYDPSGETPDEQADNDDRTLANLTYIVRTVHEASPDVFVVIEPRCETGVVGSLAAGNGVNALAWILQWIRHHLSPQWMLVPPLVVNPQAFEDGLAKATRSETVGVFWRNDTLDFTGPWWWPAAAAATGPPVPGPAASANYPAAYDGVTVPAGTQRAPAYAWTDMDNAGQPFLFPKDKDRRPLLTSFTERGGAHRSIGLLAFHPSPSCAPQAISILGRLLQQHCRPGPNELTVAAGDINIDLMNTPALDAQALMFLEDAAWTDTPYTRVAPAPPTPTMLRRSAGRAANELATPAQYLKDDCLDYGWVRYGAGTAPAVGAPAATVVNRIAGAAAAPPFPPLTTDMTMPLAAFPGLADPNAAFRTRWNFGHISPPDQGTSDHLPVLLVV